MPKIHLPFALERVSKKTPGVYTDAVDDAAFNKSQQELNQMFMGGISVSCKNEIVINPNITLDVASASVNTNISGLEEIILTKSHNDEEESFIASGTTSPLDVETEISGNTEHYQAVIKNNQTTTTITKDMYICIIGSYSGETLNNDVVNEFEKYYVDNVAFKTEIDTKYGEYIWILIPENQHLEYITCQGIEMSFNEPISFNLSEGRFKGIYRVYKNSKKLLPETWKIHLNS